MARLDRDMPDGISIPKSYSTVDDATAKQAATAAPTAYLPDQNVVTGRQPRPGDPGYEEFFAARNAKYQKARETTQAGENPDNPMPTTDPGKGMHWANYGGVWKAYPDTVVGSGSGGGGNGGSGGGGGNGNNTDAATAATTAANLVAAQNQAAIDAEKKAGRQSAYDVLFNEFNKYGLGSLVESIKGMITDAAVSPSQFAIALQNTKEYQQRFSANQDRIKAGLRALTPAEYVGLEDQYQNIMRNYGLPASYYGKDSLGTQAGFNKLLSNDVSAAELEDRIATAQQRVVNSNPEVLKALKQFYPDINNADILAYTLDPQNALTDIKRKVTAAEIGGAALAQGLQANGGTAESLAGQGITKAQAQQGYTDIAGILPRGSQLADIYGQQPYTQGTAEAEVFNTAGAADAAARRKKLTSLETAQFSGSSGVGSLGRDKAIYGAAQGQSGLY